MHISYKLDNIPEVSKLSEMKAMQSARGRFDLMSDVACLLQSWGVIEETWLFESIEQPVPARQMPAETLPEDVALTPDDLHISWRGDSKFFATCSRAVAGAIIATSSSSSDAAHCASFGLHQPSVCHTTTQGKRPSSHGIT